MTEKTETSVVQLDWRDHAGIDHDLYVVVHHAPDALSAEIVDAARTFVPEVCAYVFAAQILDEACGAGRLA